MSRQLKLVKGDPADPTTEVDLISTGSTGWRGLRGKLGGAPFALDGREEGKIPETYVLSNLQTSHDDAADAIMTFVDLLRDAARYFEDLEQSEPVSIVQQATNETNPRYALVFGSPELMPPDLYDLPFEVNSDLEEVELTIIREHPWTSGAVGQTGTALAISPHWSGKLIEEGDFDSSTEGGGSTVADEATIDGSKLKITLVASNDAYSSFTSLTDDQKGLIVGFKLDPDTLSMATNDMIYIAKGIGSSVGGETNDWLVSLAYDGSSFEVRASIVDDAGDQADGSYADITNEEHDVLIEWAAASAAAADDGYINLYIDGVLVDSITGVDNDQRANDELQAGAEGVDAGTSGIFYIWSIYYAYERDGIPTRVHVANERNEVLITDIKINDGGAFTDAALGADIFPTTPVQDDYTVFGSTDQPLKTIVIPKLSVVGDLTTTTLTLDYYDGSNFVALTLGTDYTCYPGPDLEACFEQVAEDIIINVKPPYDCSKTTLDGSNCYWYKIREGNAAPSYAAVPELSEFHFPYAQRDNVVEIPGGSLKGDSHPKLLWRLRSPAGGDENPGFANTSRILAGIRSVGLDKFVMSLNAGGDDNPSDWATAQVTDATATTDTKAPAGKHSAVDFSGDSTMVARVRFTGTDILKYYRGEFLAMIRCEQSGGAVGDLSVKLRTFINSTDAYSPKKDTLEVKLAGEDQGPELVDLGLLQLPFARTYAADSLEGMDLIFELHAARTTGAATLKLYDLLLLPIDEGSIGVDHNADGDSDGTAALRGAKAIDLDAGIIDWRARTYLVDSGNLITAEDWLIMNEPPEFRNLGEKHRIYFVALHYPSGGAFGTGPLIASFGMHFSVEIFGHYRFAVLRGDK